MAAASHAEPLPRRRQAELFPGWDRNTPTGRVQALVALLAQLPNDLLPLGVRLAGHVAIDEGTWLDVAAAAGRADGVPLRYVLAPQRWPTPIRARDRAFHLLRHRTPKSLADIAAPWGLATHDAVMNGICRHEERQGEARRPPLGLALVDPPIHPGGPTALEAELALWHLPAVCPSPEGPSWLVVVCAVAAVHEALVHEVLGGVRAPEAVRARRHTWHLLDVCGGYACTEIARAFGVDDTKVSGGIRAHRATGEGVAITATPSARSPREIQVDREAGG
jgi:hypothetical protein